MEREGTAVDEHFDGRKARVSSRTLTWRLGALALAATGALVGCGGHAATTNSQSSPVAAPSIDDSSGTVLPPTTGPSVGSDDSATSAPATDAPTASSGGTVTPVAPRADAVTGASGAQARTVPGVADGAAALPPTAAVANNGRCAVRSLKLAPIDLEGSPGGTYANFRLVNVSSSACAVRGYVNATLIGDNGKDLPTSVRDEDGPNVWVKVAPKGAAQFHLRFPNPMSGSTPCNPPNAAKVRISLTGTSGTLTSATPEGGIQACNGQVSTAPVSST